AHFAKPEPGAGLALETRSDRSRDASAVTGSGLREKALPRNHVRSKTWPTRISRATIPRFTRVRSGVRTAGKQRCRVHAEPIQSRDGPISHSREGDFRSEQMGYYHCKHR